MSKVKIIFYTDDKGKVPVFEWLKTLPKKVQAKGIFRIFRLAEMGHELRRPEADYLQEGIYELRWCWLRVNYRILYFFHGQEIVVLAHSFTKEGEIPRQDIKLAIQRKELFKQDPKKHLFESEY